MIETTDPGLHVLIVDDQPINLSFLELHLKSMGHHVHQAPDGTEALKVLERENIEVVLSDVLMPNMDGYRLCFEMKRDERFRSVPIVLITSAPVDSENQRLAVKIGAMFLERPVTKHQIDEALREASSLPASEVLPDDSELPGKIGTLRMYNEQLVQMIEDKNLELVRQTIEARANEQKFRQLAENIRETFWISAPDSSAIHYISPAYEQIWGRSCAELYENPQAWLAYVHPEDRERVAATTVVEAPGELDFEYRIVRPDGSVRWIHARAFPVRSSAGEIIRIAGIAEDVTDRKALESELRHAQKMEAVGRLAGGIAHDFNNLLTVINGFSELALEKLNERDPHYRPIAEVRKAGGRAAALTGQLLAFSRKQVLQPRVLDVNAAVADMQRLLERLIGEDVALVSRLASNLGSIQFDPGQLEQVIVNLAVNARDAMPRGGTLTLETENVDLDEDDAPQRAGLAPGPYVLLVVADTGSGMSDEVKEHLFEPFFTTKEHGKGTGLGLSTVHGIVQQSGGHIEVQSEVDRGTKFRIYLPRVDEAPEPASTAVANESTQLCTETILLVEDDVAVRAFAQEVLAKVGYKVLEARSGDEALAIAQRHSRSIDLLLTDVVMPGMSSPQVARRLLSLEPDLRVIYMSGYTDAEVFRDAAIGPDVPFLRKPFGTAKLLSTIRKTLDAPPKARS